jgi:hypothetical protein
MENKAMEQRFYCCSLIFFYQNMPIIIIILPIYENNMYTASLTSIKVKVLSR